MQSDAGSLPCFQIRQLHRPSDVPDHGLLCDILWSDPDEVSLINSIYCLLLSQGFHPVILYDLKRKKWPEIETEDSGNLFCWSRPS